MTPNLLKHKNWEYSTKLWYGEYHTCIEIGPFSRYPTTSLVPVGIISARHRERSRYTTRGVVVSIYTSDTRFAEEIIYFNQNRIRSVKTPFNQSHLDILNDTSIKVEIRDKLYYSKYKFKVHTLKNYSYGFNRESWNEKCRSVNTWIQNTFSDSRTQAQTNWTYNYFGMEYVDVMYIYTNDEPSLMLYKMAYGDDFHIEITRAFTPGEFASV